MFDFPQQDVDGRQVKVKHPAKPKTGVIGCFLFFIVMSDAEIICNVE
jgi:hypothetical protein